MTTFPIGWNGQRGTEANLSSNPSWTKLDPVFRSRLLSLFMASGGKVGFGTGWRSSAQQAAGRERSPGTHVAPGKSWHEVGMAADLVGDMKWLTANAARFGLATGANWKRPEEWHVYPAEIPAARPLNAPAPKLSGGSGGGSAPPAQFSAENVAQVAYQAGFRGEDLVKMVAIAKRESSWKPNAHRSDVDKSRLSGDRGLWQINYIWDAQLIQAGIIKQKSDLFDPVTNAKAAMYVLQKQGWAAWGATSKGWTHGGNALYGTNMAEARQIVQRATASGLISKPYTQASNTMPTRSGASTTNTGPSGVPTDTTLIQTNYGIFAVYQVAPGVHVHYGIPWWDGSVQFDRSKVRRVTEAQWKSSYGNSIYAGSAAELGTIRVTFGTYRKFWDSILNQVMGVNNPARNDPGVLRVIAEFAGRPDMTEAELQNKLQATGWFQRHTQDQLEWNSLSEAERDKRLQETEARLIDTVWQYMGFQADETTPEVRNYAANVASGKIGFGLYVEIIKGLAAEMPESPWAREQRNEEEAQRQRPIDIENTSQRIREVSERWGVAWSPETIQSWAKDMVEKKKSDEDLIMEFRKQAQVLYPWKDPEVETATAASPWLETYRRVMERSGSISTPEVQRSLQAGQAVFDFEKELKKGDAWLETQNGRDAMYSTVSELGARMGFV
jgi:hypothetical protein